MKKQISEANLIRLLEMADSAYNITHYQACHCEELENWILEHAKTCSDLKLKKLSEDTVKFADKFLNKLKEMREEDNIVWESKIFEEGGTFIKKVTDGFQLWEIPQYGGEPRYCKWFVTLEDAIKEAESYT